MKPLTTIIADMRDTAAMLAEQANDLEELARLFGMPVPTRTTVAAPVVSAPPPPVTPPPPPTTVAPEPEEAEAKPITRRQVAAPRVPAKRFLNTAEKANIREQWNGFISGLEEREAKGEVFAEDIRLKYRLEMAKSYRCTPQQIQALTARKPAVRTAPARPLSPDEKEGIKKDWGTIPEHLRTSTNRAALAAKYHCSVTQVFALTRADGHQQRISQLGRAKQNGGNSHQPHPQGESPQPPPSAATAAPTR